MPILTGLLVAGACTAVTAIVNEGFKARLRGEQKRVDEKETRFYKEASRQRVEAGAHRYLPSRLRTEDDLSHLTLSEKDTAGLALAKDVSANAETVAAQSQTASGLDKLIGAFNGPLGTALTVARVAIPLLSGGVALIKGLLGKKKQKKRIKREQDMMRGNASQLAMTNPTFAEAFPSAAEKAAAKESAEVAKLKKQIAAEKAKQTRTSKELSKSNEFVGSDGNRKDKPN